MSMIGKVARAIDVAGTAWLNEQSGRVEWYDVPGEVLARAAIEAMREPTRAMTRAIRDPGGWVEDMPEEIYRQMIDAALKEPLSQGAPQERQSDPATPR
jgi:hypothetical protein